MSFLVQNPERYKSCRPYLKSFKPSNPILNFAWTVLSGRYEQLQRWPEKAEAEWLLDATCPAAAKDNFRAALQQTVVPALYNNTFTDVSGDMLESLLLSLERERIGGAVAQVKSMADVEKIMGDFGRLKSALEANEPTWIQPFGPSYIRQPLSIIKEFWGDPIPFGMPGLDSWMQGGGRLGELITVIALTGGGKSLLQLWWALSQAMLGYPTLYVSFDNVVGEMLSRMFCAISGVLMDETESIDESQYAAKLEVMVERFPGLYSCFFFEKWPRGQRDCNDIRRLIDQIEQKKQIKLKVVYTDYGDCIKPIGSHKENRFAMDEVFSGLAAMAEELKHLHITTTQAHKAGRYLDIIDIDNAAEAWQKMWHSSVAMAISQNRLEKKMGLARLLIGKARRVLVDYLVSLLMNPNTMRVMENPNIPIQFRADLDQEQAAQTEKGSKKVKGLPPPAESMIAPVLSPGFSNAVQQRLILPPPPRIWVPGFQAAA